MAHVCRYQHASERGVERFLVASDGAGRGQTCSVFGPTDLTLDNWRFFAAACRFMEGKAAGEQMEGYTSMVRRDPLGVVGSIAAWEHGGVSLYVAFGSPLPSVSLTEGPITLRAFADRDLPVVEAASRDALIPTISTIPPAFTEAAGRAYIERQNQRSLSGEGWSLAIADAGTDVAVGQIGLWIGHLSKGRAEIGYWIAPGSRRMGAASRALGLLVGWAFEQLDVDRLSLFIEPWNEGSIKTAERAGFTRDGTLRGWERIDGESKDMLSFARLRSDGRADV